MTTLLQMVVMNVLMAALLVCVVLLVRRVCKRPAVLHALWLLVLLKLVTPPFVAVPIFAFDAPPKPRTPAPTVAPEPPPARLLQPLPDFALLPELDEPVAEQPAPEDFRPEPVVPVEPAAVPLPVTPPPQPAPVSTPAAPEVPTTAEVWAALAWVEWLGVMWLTGSAFWLAIALLRVRRFQRLLRDATKADVSLQVEAHALAQRLGYTCSPEVWLLPGHFSPMLWSFFGTPRLVLPLALLQRLSAEQRGALLLHELAHWVRRDHWVRWLEMIVLALYWWLPLTWWVRRQLHEVEEECCDAWVVWAAPEAAKAYATALVATLDFLAGGPVQALPLAASGLGHLDLLKRRLTMIMRGNTPRALTLPALVAILALGGLLLPLWPTLAQNVPGGEEEQQPKDPPKPPRPPLDEKKQQEAHKLHEEMQALHQAFEKQRAEFEKKMQGLREKMHKLHGDDFRPGPGGPGGPGGDKPGQPGRGPGGDKPGQPGRGPDGGPGGPGGFKPMGQGGQGGFKPMGPGGQGDQRIIQLERKLEELLREIQELRRTMGPGGRPPMRQPGGDDDRPNPRPGPMQPNFDRNQPQPPPGGFRPRPGQPGPDGDAPQPPRPDRPRPPADELD